MARLFLAVNLLMTFSGVDAVAREFEKDTIVTSDGDLEISFLGHGTLMFTFNGKVIHVDPWGRLADYAEMPKGHVILLTHEHSDHLDPRALAQVRTEKSVVVAPEACATQINGALIMKNGDKKRIEGLEMEAVPAYNLVHMRSEGVPYHPKGRGNGYVITFGDKRVYVAGDTENTPEMKSLKRVDIAFLPMNLPYTMTPEMVADGARAFKPKILYPYHYGDTDPSKVLDLLEDQPEIEVRIRKME